MINKLKEKGLKSTKQRKLLLDIIYKLQDEATISNICKFVEHEMDKSTVYRIIELFLEKNIISKELNYNNEAYFSVKEDHGHYFTCIKCHKKERIDTCPIKELEDKLINEKGYKLLNHRVEVNGVCNECNK